MKPKITFYKDNKISKKQEISTKKIIKDFFGAYNGNELNMPFERLILNYMSINYGGFDKLSKEIWNSLYQEREEYIKKNKDD